jgi:hypothetical protein
MKIVHRNAAQHTSRTRDAALRRLGRTNRWLIGATVLLTGVLTDVAANAFPGHKVTVKRTSAKHAKASSTKHSAGKHKPLARPAAPPKTTTEAAPQAPAEEASTPAPAESAPAEETHAPTQESAPESAPAPAETASPEVHEAPAPEPEASEPVVSGGS